MKFIKMHMIALSWLFLCVVMIPMISEFILDGPNPVVANILLIIGMLGMIMIYLMFKKRVVGMTKLMRVIVYYCIIPMSLIFLLLIFVDTIKYIANIFGG